MKKIISTILILILLVFANGCYYVFHGQFKSMEKLKQGKDLNLYECCSIYTMHTAVWMFGWIISPEAAEQAFLMSFVPEGAYITRENDFFTKSKVVQKIKGTEREKLVYAPSQFSLSNSEVRYALAIDGAEYRMHLIDNDEGMIQTEECVVKAAYNNYIGSFNVAKTTVKICYPLMIYLQDKGWLHTYTISYQS